jgi:UDP-2,3-diacylglucosamine hydrolase
VPDRGTLGILAGGGPLPGHLIEACRASGRSCFVIAFEGHADPAVIGEAPHAWVRLGAAAETLGLLRVEGVTEIVMAGPVRRPSLRELRPDGRAARFLARGMLKRGDDGLLGAVVRALEEEEGFRIVGTDSILTDLRATTGAFGKCRPDDAANADIARGVEVVRRIGELDIGQAAVVRDGIVLGVEAAEGTAGLLARLVPFRAPERGGVLVKLAKPNQERRADMPTIGPDTVTGAEAAGLSGIAVMTGATLVIDRAETVARADAAGLFVCGIRPADYVADYEAG